MIEMIHDRREREVLIYTDDPQLAQRIRKKIHMYGAVYSGREHGYSWRISSRVALISVKSLGIQNSQIAHIEK